MGQRWFRSFQAFGAAAFVGLLLSPKSVLPQTAISTHCMWLGYYYDAAHKRVNSPFVAAPLVDGTRISDEFGPRQHPKYHRLRMHFGLDLAAPIGAPVHSLAAGVIVQAGRMGGFGLCVRIRHSDSVETLYAHASKLTAGIKVGARVTRGQVIALVGSSGVSTGPHLHIEMRINGMPVHLACSCNAPLLAAKGTGNAPSLVRQRASAPSRELSPKLLTRHFQSQRRG